MTVPEMLNRIRSFSDKSCGMGAAEDEIANAERTLGVSFPKSYRSFLANVGWAEFAHEQIYGLGSDTPPYLELVSITRLERSEMMPPLPAHLVPIMNDGAGNHYCLDTLRMKHEECPVVFWDHEQAQNQIPDQIGPSFDHWLIERLIDLASS